MSVSAPAKGTKILGIVLVLAGRRSTNQESEAHNPMHI